MPEITLNSMSAHGWPGATRDDLPAYNKFAHIQHGDATTQSSGVGALGGKPPAYGMPEPRKPTYQYVDTGEEAVSNQNVLWSDSASWCTMVSLWRPGQAGLAHIVPGPLSVRDTLKVLNLYPGTPTEIHLATMPVHRDKQDGFVAVRNAIAAHYAENYVNIKVYLITGYQQKEWEQKHQLAVDPKTGAYPKFNA